VAYPHGERRGRRAGVFGTGRGAESKNRSEASSDTDGPRKLQPQGGLAERRGRSGDARLPAGETYWSTVPEVGRMVDGFPERSRWIRALGNAVVPQVAEWIGGRVREHAEEKQ
jgi:site-specific DNA-cytosine methylase